MTNPLDRLIGMTLLAVTTEPGSVRLQFTGCDLSAYSKGRSSGPLASFIGKTVQSVTYSSTESLDLAFGAGKSFKVSLKHDDYTGPEAFCARFDDGMWIVE